MKLPRIDSDWSGKWDCAPWRKGLDGCCLTIWPVLNTSSCGGGEPSIKFKLVFEAWFWTRGQE